MGFPLVSGAALQREADVTYNVANFLETLQAHISVVENMVSIKV